MLETLGKLALAVLLGGVIGLERGAHHRPAGFRTHMVVSLGACLFMLVSLYMAELGPRTADPGRIASQVIPGIGFLGAGTILKTGLTVKGLTTAACLWTSAAIGLAVGAGFWWGAVAGSLLTVVSIFAFRGVEKRLFGDGPGRFLIRAKDEPGLVGRIEEALRAARAELKEIDVHREGNALEISVEARPAERLDAESLGKSLKAIPGVESVDGR